jgi:hypothetical protein
MIIGGSMLNWKFWACIRAIMVKAVWGSRTPSFDVIVNVAKSSSATWRSTIYNLKFWRQNMKQIFQDEVSFAYFEVEEICRIISNYIEVQIIQFGCVLMWLLLGKLCEIFVDFVESVFYLWKSIDHNALDDILYNNTFIRYWPEMVTETTDCRWQHCIKRLCVANPVLYHVFWGSRLGNGVPKHTTSIPKGWNTCN